jgi:hypothetical protein
VFLSRSFGFLHGKERNSNNIIFSGARWEKSLNTKSLWFTHLSRRYSTWRLKSNFLSSAKKNRIVFLCTSSERVSEQIFFNRFQRCLTWNWVSFDRRKYLMSAILSAFDTISR